MKFIEKIMLGLIAIYVIVCVADMVLPPAQPARPLSDEEAYRFYLEEKTRQEKLQRLIIN